MSRTMGNAGLGTPVRSTRRRARRAAILVGLLAAFATPAFAGEGTLPVPAVTIYPGDVIRDQLLVDRETLTAQGAQAAVFGDRQRLVGKIARRTLLPGQPIPLNAVGDPKAVLVGALAKIIYQDRGLTIATYATVLQSGAPGDLVSLRNLESGRMIAGIVQGDGTVRINNE